MNNKATTILTILFTIVIASVTIYYGFFVDDQAELRKKWFNYGNEMKRSESQLTSIMNDIQMAQGSSSCDTHSQCRAIGIGSKTCKEFKEYLVYSTKDSNETRLLRLVEEFNILHEKKYNLSIVVSQCGTKPAPIYCVDGRCVARPR